jgi:hypothetical protein
MKSMHSEAPLDAETIERLEEQSGLLLRIYQAEFAKDPVSPATKSSRSNMIALRHSINQIYGQAAGLEAAKVANSLDPATYAFSTEEQAD